MMEFTSHAIRSPWTVRVLLAVAFVSCSVHGQLSFGGQDGRGFQLTATQTYFRSGDDVTLTCTKSTNQESSPRSLVFPENKGITWERNGQSLFSTSPDRGSCRVQAEMLFGKPAVTSRDLEYVNCTEDVTSVRVTIRNVTVSPGGDRWVCSKFPFLESNVVTLNNFVAVSGVTLTVQDHFPNDASTGVLLTLSCRASPSNPPSAITWTLLALDGHPLPLPGRSRSFSSTDGYGRVSVTVELAMAADPRYDKASVTCMANNAVAGDAVVGDSKTVVSSVVKLDLKRAPRILLSATPSNQVTEGTDVTLTCSAHGHPTPEVRWRKDGGFLPGGLLEADTPIVKLSPVRTPDQGEYICKASNGVVPDAVNSVYLSVDEPKRTLKISDKDRSTEITDDKTTTTTKGIDDSLKVGSSLGTGDGDGGSSSSSNGGTIAAVIISVIVIMAAVVVVVLWVLYRRRKRNVMSSPSSSDSLFPHYPNRSISAPRPGVYAPRSSQRPTTTSPLNMDSFPQYLELPPAPSPPGGITNSGYGFSPKSRRANKQRPLPAAPSPYDESRHTWDSGYDEIRDVTPDRMTSSDGYEVPRVVEQEDEDDEEECIYDVARPELGEGERRPSGVRRNTYMNENSFSTHM